MTTRWIGALRLHTSQYTVRTVRLVKKKTTLYLLSRAIREKVNNATAQYCKEARGGGQASRTDSQHREKMNSRIVEIHRWLGLSGKVTQH